MILAGFARERLLLYALGLSILAGTLAATTVAEAQTIRPFTTDGCSAFPDGSPHQNELWLECCVAHDRAYWLGGTYTQREAADRRLRQCVQEVGAPAVASLMLIGVRVGGSPFWPTTFRWGYGWDYPRGYRELTPEELAQARRLTDPEAIAVESLH